MEPIVREQYTLELGIAEGNAFLGITSTGLDMSCIKKLREDVDSIHQYAKSKGFDLVFANTTDKRFVSLWNRVRPCYDVVEVEPGNWVGAWEV